MAPPAGRALLPTAAALALAAASAAVLGSEAPLGECRGAQPEEEDSAALLQSLGGRQTAVAQAACQQQGGAGAVFGWLRTNVGDGDSPTVPALKSWAASFIDKPCPRKVSKVLREMDINKNGIVSDSEFSDHVCQDTTMPPEVLSWVGDHILVERLLHRRKPHAIQKMFLLQQSEVEETEHQAKETEHHGELALLDRTIVKKSDPKCPVVRGACGIVCSTAGAITSDVGCAAAASGWIAACEAIGGGPEDPLADACAGLSGTIGSACIAVVGAGGPFTSFACSKALGC